MQLSDIWNSILKPKYSWLHTNLQYKAARGHVLFWCTDESLPNNARNNSSASAKAEIKALFSFHHIKNTLMVLLTHRKRHITKKKRKEKQQEKKNWPNSSHSTFHYADRDSANWSTRIGLSITLEVKMQRVFLCQQLL